MQEKTEQTTIGENIFTIYSPEVEVLFLLMNNIGRKTMAKLLATNPDALYFDESVYSVTFSTTLSYDVFSSIIKDEHVHSTHYNVCIEDDWWN